MTVDHTQKVCDKRGVLHLFSGQGFSIANAANHTSIKKVVQQICRQGRAIATGKGHNCSSIRALFK